MAGTNLGTRWNCYECNTLFFDLNREKALCPKCGADQKANPKKKLIKKAEPKPESEPPELSEDDIEFDDDAGDSNIESFEQLEEAANSDEDEMDSY